MPDVGAPLGVVRVPVASLVPDPANARKHGDENLDAIAASLRRWGQTEPMIAQEGTDRVIAGNGRLAAMKNLGWSHADVVYLAIDDLNATALAIAMNRPAELAEWDSETLGRLLSELREENFHPRSPRVATFEHPASRTRPRSPNLRNPRVAPAGFYPPESSSSPEHRMERDPVGPEPVRHPMASAT